jgi:hypothetical protein
VSFAEHDEVIETLPSKGADHPLRDRVLLPAGGAVGTPNQAVTAWATARPEPEVEAIHRGVGTGGAAYDATLEDLARSQNGVVAAAFGQALNYPVGRLLFAKAAWPAAPVFAPLVRSLLGAGLVNAAGRIGRARALLRPDLTEGARSARLRVSPLDDAHVWRRARGPAPATP